MSGAEGQNRTWLVYKGKTSRRRLQYPGASCLQQSMGEGGLPFALLGHKADHPQNILNSMILNVT